VLIIHGYGEHLRRYDELAARLVDGGFAVVAVDVRGHGKSDGQRGHVVRFDEYLIDVAAGFEMLASLHPGGGKRVLLGHSNGGLVALRYALSSAGTRPDALVLSGPLLKLAVQVPGWKSTLGRGLSRIAPATSLANDVDSTLLSHDASVGKAYEDDPLVHRVATARYFTEMTTAAADALERGKKLNIPMLLLQGGADKIVDPDGSRQLHRTAPRDHRYIEYEGFYHEIFNETDQGLWNGSSEVAET
jgi:lysophospholipase